MSRDEEEITEQLEYLRYIFWESFGFGVKRAKPKVGEDIVHFGILEKNNAVNPFNRDHLSEDMYTVATKDIFHIFWKNCTRVQLTYLHYINNLLLQIYPC